VLLAGYKISRRRHDEIGRALYDRGRRDATPF
jgi:hypothetical protein